MRLHTPGEEIELSHNLYRKFKIFTRRRQPLELNGTTWIIGISNQIYLREYRRKGPNNHVHANELNEDL